MKNDLYVLKSRQYLPERLKKYAGKVVDAKKVGAEKKHILRAATKEELKVKETLSGMPRYKEGNIVYLTMGGCIARILSVKEDNKYGIEIVDGSATEIYGSAIARPASKREIEGWYKTRAKRVSAPSYKKGDLIDCHDMDWIREHCTFDHKKRVWSHQGDNLAEILVQAAAGKTFEIRDVGELMQGAGTKWHYEITDNYNIPEWMIAECVYSAPVETQPTIEVGDTVKLPYDMYSPDLAGCKGRVVAQCGHLSDVTLDNGEWRRVVTKALTLVSKAAPESTKPVQSLTQRIEKLEKELSELKRRVG